MNMKPFDHNSALARAATPSMKYKGDEPFHEWQTKARAKLLQLLGIDRIKRATDTKFNIEYVKEEDTYTEYRFTLQPEVGYSFPSVMRVPKGLSGKLPVMICLQGHSTGMHISLGQPKYERDVASISGGDRDFCVRAVKEGYVAVAVEQRNFGECGGAGEKGPACLYSTMIAFMLGRTTIGERVVDVSTVIDALTENFDFIDSEKINVMGNSGGGTATFYAAAIDERIKIAIPSCAYCTYKDSIAAMPHCSCNFIPGILDYFEMEDISGLIAPRKLIVVNGAKDDIFPEQGVKEAYETTKKLYFASGAPENCRLVTGPEGHRFYADAAWPVIHEFADLA